MIRKTYSLFVVVSGMLALFSGVCEAQAANPDFGQVHSQETTEMPEGKNPEQAENDQRKMEMLVENQNVAGQFAAGYTIPDTGEYSLTIAIHESRAASIVERAPQELPAVPETPQASEIPSYDSIEPGGSHETQAYYLPVESSWNSYASEIPSYDSIEPGGSHETQAYYLPVEPSWDSYAPEIPSYFSPKSNDLHEVALYPFSGEALTDRADSNAAAVEPKGPVNGALSGFLQNFVGINDAVHDPVQINQDYIGEVQTLTYKNTSAADNKGSLLLMAKSDYVFPRRTVIMTYELNKETWAITVTIKDTQGDRQETYIHFPKDGLKYIQQLLAMYKLAEKGQGPGRSQWESSNVAGFVESIELILNSVLSKTGLAAEKDPGDGQIYLTDKLIRTLMDIASRAGIPLTHEEAMQAFVPSQTDIVFLSLIHKIIARLKLPESEPSEAEIESYIRINARRDVKLTKKEAAEQLKRRALKMQDATEKEISSLIKAAKRLGIRLTREQAIQYIRSFAH